MNNNTTNNEKRIFYLSGKIDEASIRPINFEILKLIQEDEESNASLKNFQPKPIKLFINSFGGSVYDAWSLIDIILRSETPIYTYCTGYVMSAGFLIFLAGHKRYATPNATMLYHQLSAGGWNKILDLQQDLQEYERLQSDIEKYVCERTSIPYSILEENKQKKLDWYIHSEDFEKYNLAELLPHSIQKEENK